MNNIANAFKSMARNLSMTLASFALVFLTLLVVGSVLVLSFNTNYIATEVIQSITISAFVDPNATEEESKQLESELLAINGISEVEYSTKEEELKSISDTFGEDGETIYEFYAPINPLSDVYVVSVDDTVTDFTAVNDEIKELDNIIDSSFGEESTTDNFVKTMQLIQWISIIVSAILAFVSLFIISNTIKLNITARYTEIEIMRLVGATKMYIRMPFVIEGIFIGAVAGLISAGLIHYGYIEALQTEFLAIMSTSLVTSTIIAEYIYLILPIGGMIIGGIGSLFAIRKYLSK